MRLSEQELTAIQNTFKSKVPLSKFQVFLYGSRVDDDYKGGDIDLAVVVESENKQTAEDLILDLLVYLKSNRLIGDRRIDLKIFSFEELIINPFALVISKNWICIFNQK